MHIYIPYIPLMIEQKSLFCQKVGGLSPPPGSAGPENDYIIDLIPDSDAILKILSVDFCGKVKVNSDSSFKIV